MTKKISDKKTTKNQNVFFLGCGKMGSILAKKLVEDKIVISSNLKVLKRNAANQINGINYISSTKDLDKNYRADLVFLAIKPQDSSKILQEFSQAKIFHPKTIFISILSGKKISFFTRFFGDKAKVVRSMPNLPIQYSQGIFTYFCNKNITKLEVKNLQKIFEKFGYAFELKNENLFSVATAIFGSGPAYIFLLQEIFSQLTIKLGIDKNKSEQLIKKLFFGSSLMCDQQNQGFEDLRKSVTSDKGTTASAIQVLQKNQNLKKIFKKAFDAAMKRSDELGEK